MTSRRINFDASDQQQHTAIISQNPVLSRGNQRIHSPDIYGAGSDSSGDEVARAPMQLQQLRPRPQSAPPVIGLNQREAKIRFETFEALKNVFPSLRRKRWASNGFFLNENNEVECFCCHFTIQEWSEIKDPMKHHTLEFPDCRFRKGDDCGNVPFGCRKLSSSEDEEYMAKKPRRGIFETPPRTPHESHAGQDLRPMNSTNLPPNIMPGTSVLLTPVSPDRTRRGTKRQRNMRN